MLLADLILDLKGAVSVYFPLRTKSLIASYIFEWLRHFELEVRVEEGTTSTKYCLESFGSEQRLSRPISSLLGKT